MRLESSILEMNNKHFASTAQQLPSAQQKGKTNSIFYHQELEKLVDEDTKIKEIAKKIARGGKITPEEEEYIKEHDPETLRKAQMAKEEGDRLKQRLEQSKDPKEAQEAMDQADILVAAAKKNKDIYGELLAEAIRSAVANAKKGNNEAFDKQTLVDSAKDDSGVQETEDGSLEENIEDNILEKSYHKKKTGNLFDEEA